MPPRILFAQQKSRFSLWLRLGALIGGLASLGLVIAKINTPTDPVLDLSIEQHIAREVSLTPDPALEEPVARGKLSALATDPKPSTPLLPSTQPEADTEKTLEIEVQNGDSLSTVFERAGLSAKEVQQVVDLGKPAASLQPMASYKDWIDAGMIPSLAAARLIR